MYIYPRSALFSCSLCLSPVLRIFPIYICSTSPRDSLGILLDGSNPATDCDSNPSYNEMKRALEVLHCVFRAYKILLQFLLHRGRGYFPL